MPPLAPRRVLTRVSAGYFSIVRASGGGGGGEGEDAHFRAALGVLAVAVALGSLGGGSLKLGSWTQRARLGDCPGAQTWAGAEPLRPDLSLAY